MNDFKNYTVFDISGAVASPECRKLAELATGKVVLEVGSQHGSSTVSMGQVCKQLVAVDWHRGDDHAAHMDTVAGFWDNLKRYKVLDKVIPVVGRFEDAAAMLVPGSFDLAFIDAFHSYEACRSHILLALPLLKPGGWFAVHDYGWPNFPGVQRAVDELVGTPWVVFKTLAIFTASQVKR